MKSWSNVKEYVVKIMNKALREEKFPNHWKIGRVKVLYKGLGKDPQLLKSYRPLTLLPVMGKLYEKIINRKILEIIDGSNQLHQRQYGFRQGKGTEDAVVELLQKVNATEKKYVLRIFLDIAGAFENA